ncbi:MAG: restriction endonuclease subunit S [Vicinamibacterales bacterium]
MSRTEQQAGRWPARRLGDVLVRHNEVVHPGQRTGEGIFVGLEHIEPNSGRRIGSMPIDLGNLTGRKPTFCRGQIVYGYLRPYLNKVWVAEFDGYSSVDQFAFNVRPDLAVTEFIAAFMRSETFIRRASIVTTTGQLPRIGTEQIAAVPVELPPLDAQREIVETLTRQLDAVSAARLAAEEQLAMLGAVPAALLRSIFGRQ